MWQVQIDIGLKIGVEQLSLLQSWQIAMSQSQPHIELSDLDGFN